MRRWIGFYPPPRDWGRLLSNALANIIDEFRRPPELGEPAVLRRNLLITVWVRLGINIAGLPQVLYRPDLLHSAYFPNNLLAAAHVALNLYVLYRIRSNRRVTWQWAFALSTFDAAVVTTGQLIGGGFHHPWFVIYYPTVAMFAVVFTSFTLSFAWVTMVAALYAGVSLMAEPGLDFDMQDEKVLFMRIAAMYAVVCAVNLISRFERIRRLDAVERERELQQERIDLSHSIHDTVGQSAYLIGLGLETAKELVNDSDKELTARLEATHSLSKLTMWELRHPIDAGPIFEGREISSVLRSHASTFSTITSIPTEVFQTGDEPELSLTTKELLLSVAHNAMTNSFQHSKAAKVTITLDFEPEQLGLTISDDGIGLPEDHEGRGRLISVTTEVERAGGQLEAAPGESGSGTVVTCTIPLEAQ